MTNPFDDDAATFAVVVNGEGQHSLWPTFRPVPDGWSAVGPSGSKRDCLDWIDAHWADLRPMTLIAHMDATARRTGA